MSEYIKKEDALKALHDFWDECINFDGSGTELMLDNEGVIDDLPTYSFPNSAENKGFDGMTNGEVIKAVFPYVTAEDTSSDRLIETDLDEYFVLLRKKWWNAPYQKGGEE